jgi:DNA-binding XRE family transcriptional regulator
MNALAVNLKYLRKNHKPKQTQADMANLIGVSISTYGSYEEGRAEPRLENLQKITSFFGIAVEDLLNGNLAANGVGEKQSSQRSNSVNSENGAGPRILTVTLDKTGKDNIEWVPVKAAAGYTSGFADPEFIQDLPVFQIPFLDQRKKYRAFTIEGDSMLPIPSGSMIFAEYAEDWTQIKDGTACIVVTESDGIVFKKVYNYLNKQNCLLLVSSNSRFAPYLVAAGEVLEVWKFAGFFSNQLLEEMKN